MPVHGTHRGRMVGFNVVSENVANARAFTSQKQNKTNKGYGGAAGMRSRLAARKAAAADPATKIHFIINHNLFHEEAVLNLQVLTSDT
eukprot:7673313-Heterocapsa_arctica.AAC.1